MMRTIRASLVLVVLLSAMAGWAQPACSTCWTYTYDGVGNISVAGVDSYHYDTAGRLISATAGGAANAVTYQYDTFGNRIAAMPATGAAKCVGNTDCDLPVTVSRTTNHFIMTGVGYDQAGNLSQLDASNSFTFDALSMAQSAHLGSTNLQYVYTADDERVAVYDGALWTWTIRDLGARPLSEFTSLNTTSGGTTSYGNANLTWSRDYVYRGGALLASEARKSYSDSTVISERFHLDHLGTARLVTDDNGNKLGLHTYYPFGGELDSLPYEQPEAELKFTGHTRDTGRNGGLSLDYMHARYYSANAGRFLSVDPDLGKIQAPQSLNRYAYVRNSPANATDPTGKYVETPADVIMLAIDLGIAGYEQIRHGQVSAVTKVAIAADLLTLATPGAVAGGAFVRTGAAAAHVAAPVVKAMRATSLAMKPLQMAAATSSNGNSSGSEPTASEPPASNEAPPATEEARNPAQDKRLSKGEIKQLENAGHDVHEMKGGKNASKYDLFKDKDGNIYVKPKNGSGPGDPTGVNVNDLGSK